MFARRAFTLLELLVVVAIVAILAAVAVPNFMEASVRAEAGRVTADMRTMATAIEAYRVDHGMYPLGGVLNADGSMQNPHCMPAGPPAHKFLFEGLTTPVAYLTVIPVDPFMDRQAAPVAGWEPWWNRYFYTNLPMFETVMGPSPPPVIGEMVERYGEWILASAGPDLDRLDLSRHVYYDPTNGTISDGDIVRSPKLLP